MSDLVTEDDLARARIEPEFRQKLMAENLERLLEKLNDLRRTSDPKPAVARQIQEGVQLAVQLADRLHQLAPNGPQAA